MTVKDALQNVYSRMQAHHAAAAEDDQGHADDCGALADCAKAAGDKAASKAHASMGKRFADSAARHSRDSEAYGLLQKAVASMTTTKTVLAHDPDAIVPDGVKAINPGYPAGLTPVIRAGQPKMGERPVPVSPQFEKFVAIEE